MEWLLGLRVAGMPTGWDPIDDCGSIRLGSNR